MNYSIEILNKQTMVRALKLYQESLLTILELNEQIPDYNPCIDAIIQEQFDTIGLIGIFSEEQATIELKIDATAYHHFSQNHGVDFPMFNKKSDKP